MIVSWSDMDMSHFLHWQFVFRNWKSIEYLVLNVNAFKQQFNHMYLQNL